MRATAATILGASLALACPAVADPGHGPLRVEISGYAFKPQDLQIVQGDLVVWEWSGPDTNHSVTADDGTFDSDPDGNALHEVGARYAYTFDTPGTYTYYCRTHPTVMKGRIVVTAAGNSGVPTAPKLTDVRATAKGRRLTLRFALSEAARVRFEVRRGGAVKRKVTAGFPPGTTAKTLKLTGFKAGRYSVTLVPLDASTGQPASPVKRAFTLK
jgi:plastocyanin